MRLIRLFGSIGVCPASSVRSFGRCSRSVSVVPPAYYADLLAFRARFFVQDDDGCARDRVTGCACVPALVRERVQLAERTGERGSRTEQATTARPSTAPGHDRARHVATTEQATGPRPSTARGHDRARHRATTEHGTWPRPSGDRRWVSVLVCFAAGRWIARLLSRVCALFNYVLGATARAASVAAILVAPEGGR